MIPKKADIEVGGAYFALAQRRQWMLCRYEPTAVPGKFNKIPLSPFTCMAVDAHDSQHWGAADEVLGLAEAMGPSYGVAFVFTETDPYFFIDIDDALTPQGWAARALDACNRFPFAAMEVSASGRGLHIIGSASAIPPHRSKPWDRSLGIDLYTSKRFVALTGWQVQGHAEAECTTALAEYIALHYAPDEAEQAVAVETVDPRWSGPDDDDELIRRMLNARSVASVFGVKATPKDLWEANEDVLGACFPQLEGKDRAYDASAADSALATHLAWWTGADEERMERIMRQSMLVREKWDIRPGYLRDTISKAAARQRAKGSFYYDPSLKPEAAAMPAEALQTAAVASAGAKGFVGISDLAGIFGSLIYVLRPNAVLMPNGRLVKRDQFDAWFGGPRYSVDITNEKTTKSAWEAMLFNPGFQPQRVVDECYDPRLPPNAITMGEGGELQVNSYRDLRGEMKEGDPQPFIEHLQRLIPHPGDREILLHFMACTVQNPAFRIPWAVALQGVEGNGKTFIVECLRYAIGRRATHSPRSTELTSKFNAWMHGKLLIAVDDVSIERNRAVIDTLKVMITDGHIAIEGKGVEQVTETFFANFIFTTNHMDALATHTNDRRFSIIKTAQQSVMDLQVQGMDGAYFKELWNWAQNYDGYAIVAHYLRHYRMMDEFNPMVNANRAPRTSHQMEFIQASLSAEGAIIKELIESQALGFRGGFADGYHAALALGKASSPKRINSCMRELGYVPHPALTAGRIPKPFIPGCPHQPILYVEKGHPNYSLTDRDDVQRVWMTMNCA